MKKVVNKTVCCLLIILICGFVFLLTGCMSKDIDLKCAKQSFQMSQEFNEKYGEIKSIKRLSDSVDSLDKTERYVYCEIILKDGRIINCTAILELNMEHMYVAPLSWIEGKYTGENIE